MPLWLPKTRLYVGLQRWGVQAAAAVVEARAAERGANPREETVAERADRFARAADLKEKQKQFQKSESGVRAALQAYEDFSLAIENHANAIGEAGVKIKVQRSQEYRVLQGLYPCNAICDFRPWYANVLDDAYLNVGVYKGFPSLPGFYGSLRGAQKLKSLRYAYQLVRSNYHAWVGIDEKEREFTPEQLAEHVLRAYMDVAERTNPD